MARASATSSCAICSARGCCCTSSTSRRSMPKPIRCATRARSCSELKHYDQALHDKPRWLVLNKLDLVPRGRARGARRGVRQGICAGRVRCSRSPRSTAKACRELVFAIQEWLDRHPADPPRLRRTDVDDDTTLSRGVAPHRCRIAGRGTADERARRDGASASWSRSARASSPTTAAASITRPSRAGPSEIAALQRARQGGRARVLRRDRRGHAAARLDDAPRGHPRTAGGSRRRADGARAGVRSARSPSSACTPRRSC